MDSIKSSIRDKSYKPPIINDEVDPYAPIRGKMPSLSENDLSSSEHFKTISSWVWVAHPDGVVVCFRSHEGLGKWFYLSQILIFFLLENLEPIIEKGHLIDLTTFRTLSLADMEKEIRQSEGYRVLTLLDGITQSVKLLSRNFDALETNLEEVSGPITNPELIDWHSRYALTLFMEETARLLHNYLSSVLSLRDHSNAIRKHIFQSQEPDDIQEQIDNQFSKDGMSRFIQDLRNLFLHHGVPHLGARINFAKATVDGHVYLNKESLNRRKKWHSAAKDFLNEQPDEIDLLKLVRAYQEKVLTFSAWLRYRVEEHFSDKLRETELKRQAYLAKQSNMICISLRDRLSRVANSSTLDIKQLIDIFNYLLTEEELYILKTLETNPKQWKRKAMDFAVKNVLLPKDLIEKLNSLTPKQ